MSKDKELGKLIERYAAEKRGLSSATEISAYMQGQAAELGRDVEVVRSPATIGKYLKSSSTPDEAWIDLFGVAFHLSGTQILDLHARSQT